MTEKLSPIERALVAASAMQAPDARSVLMLICEAGMTMDKPVPQEPTEGEKHYAKREKFIRRMKSSVDRVTDYAKHETLRKIEKHFRVNPPVKGAEGDQNTGSLAARLTFDKGVLSEELLAALAEDQESALSTAGQQLFDEIGKDSVWRIPSQDAIQFVQDRANLLANVPDEVHTEIMQSIEQGLQAGESRKELMARISAAFDEIGRSRAETIANTETAAAFNYARDKAMREAGVTHKKWLHSHSPLIKEPRPTHVEADGQTVPIDEPFDVGGVQFMRPADDSLGAGPEDIINCHCVAIPVESPIESGEGEGHPFRGNQWTSGELSKSTFYRGHKKGRPMGETETFISSTKDQAAPFASQVEGIVSEVRFKREPKIYPNPIPWEEYHRSWRNSALLKGYDAVPIIEPNGKAISLAVRNHDILDVKEPK